MTSPSMGLPLYSDWLEIASLVFAILTFIIATYLALRSDQSGKRFVESQVYEKIAVIYGYTDEFIKIAKQNAKPVKDGEPKMVVRASPNFLKRMETDITAVGTIAKDVPEKPRDGLFEAMDALVKAMNEAGHGAEASRLDALLRSFFN